VAELLHDKKKKEINMLEVKDSVAVITGGGGGIGLTLAKMAAKW
jgi:short-subunit dehydrogenase involved in D-alanine esterification of teichoic acids